MKTKIKGQIAAMKSVRKTWGFNPVSRVANSKKIYSRKNWKKAVDN